MDKYTLLDKKLDTILEIVQKIITIVECLSEEDTIDDMAEDSDSDGTQEFTGWAKSNFTKDGK